MANSNDLSSQEIREELERDDDDAISIQELNDAGWTPSKSSSDSEDSDERQEEGKSIEQDFVAPDDSNNEEYEELIAPQDTIHTTPATAVSSSAEQSLLPIPNKIHKGGRPKDDIWLDFQKVAGTKRDWKCRHCSKLYKFAQANRLKHHIENSCEVLKRLRRLQRQKSHDQTESVPAPATVVSVPDALSLEQADRGKRCIAGQIQTSMRNFFPKTSAAMQNRIDIALEKFICSTNVPFSVVDNPYFKHFVGELRSTYVVPSAKSVANTMLDSLYQTEKEKLNNRVAGSKAVIIQDGWTTNQSEAVIAHALSIKDKVEFLNANVVEEEKKTAQTCLRFLNEAITEAKKTFNVTVVGSITDNCNTMIAMRRQFVEENSNMIAYGCNAHLLNLIGKRMTPEALKMSIVKVQKFFRNHDLPAACLKKLGGSRPVIPGDTRWNSLIDCFQSYMKNHAKYLEISRRVDIDMNAEMKTTLRDANVFEELEKALQILTPVAISLDKLQSDSSTVADAVACWLEVECQLNGHPQSKYIEEQVKKGTPDSSVAAYMIHTKYKGRGLSKSMTDAGRRWFLKRNVHFLPILLAFQSSDSTFFADLILDESIITSLHPVAWWRTARNDNPTKISAEFFDVCETLLRLPSSSAGLERCFSTLKNIITDRRNRISMEKAQKLCFINQSLKKAL